MSSTSRILMGSLCLATGATLYVLIRSGPPVHAAGEPAQIALEGPADPARLSDAPVEPWRVELLELAYQAASGFPHFPHNKSRSRAQDQVVQAGLELGQLQRARRWIDGIDNWLRGADYADLALRLIERGETDHVQQLLDLAQEVAEDGIEADPFREDQQEWRLNAIRAKIAAAHLALGQQEQAQEFELGLAPAEQGEVAAVRDQALGPQDLEVRLTRLEGAFVAGDLDQMRASLAGFERLFDRFYEQPEQRARVEERIQAWWRKPPRQVGIELMVRLGELALEHGDPTRALELVNQGQQVLDEGAWSVEDRIALQSELLECRYRAGDAVRARQQADEARALFEGQREEIVDMFRAAALRPLAEAYAAMGERASALDAYRVAVEEGTRNINARPRAMDLVATCCSLVRSGIEPDADLWARLRRVLAGLKDPW